MVNMNVYLKVTRRTVPHLLSRSMMALEVMERSFTPLEKQLLRILKQQFLKDPTKMQKFLQDMAKQTKDLAGQAAAPIQLPPTAPAPVPPAGKKP